MMSILAIASGSSCATLTENWVSRISYQIIEARRAGNRDVIGLVIKVDQAGSHRSILNV